MAIHNINKALATLIFPVVGVASATFLFGVRYVLISLARLFVLNWLHFIFNFGSALLGDRWHSVNLLLEGILESGFPKIYHLLHPC